MSVPLKVNYQNRTANHKQVPHDRSDASPWLGDWAVADSKNRDNLYHTNQEILHRARDLSGLRCWISVKHRIGKRNKPSECTALPLSGRN
jgi:hypothetical protein